VALSRRAVQLALDHGFVAAGILASARSETWPVFRAWLDERRHADMAWLERDAEARRSFDAILPYTKAVIAVAREVSGHGDGNVARYARGDDYHRVVREELKLVVRGLRPQAPAGSHFRVCVDTAPLLEREVAVRAGLGSIGKNGMLIVPGVGSHVVLGSILTDVALAPTAFPPPADLCGSCTACLDACPTQAFVAPRVLDARRCLSYLTIEKRSAFETWEEAALEGRLFGCDDCQTACPWNASREALLSRGGPDPGASLDPSALASLTEARFQELFGRTAVFRATAPGLARNARAALRARERGCP
jgi:epoxyqueuosine reductase